MSPGEGGESTCYGNFIDALNPHLGTKMIFKEPSTMAGGAAVLGGLNEMFNFVEPSTVDALAGAVGTVLVNPTPMGMGMALFGLFSVFMGEQGKR